MFQGWALALVDFLKSSFNPSKDGFVNSNITLLNIKKVAFKVGTGCLS